MPYLVPRHNRVRTLAVVPNAITPTNLIQFLIIWQFGLHLAVLFAFTVIFQTHTGSDTVIQATFVPTDASTLTMVPDLDTHEILSRDDFPTSGFLDGGVCATSWNIDIEHNMWAMCGVGSTSLPLDLCFGNDGKGNIISEANGNISASCSGCVNSDYTKGTMLSCLCNDEQGLAVNSSIAVDNYIGNQNGTICCIGGCGSTTHG